MKLTLGRRRSIEYQILSFDIVFHVQLMKQAVKIYIPSGNNASNLVFSKSTLFPGPLVAQLKALLRANHD